MLKFEIGKLFFLLLFWHSYGKKTNDKVQKEKEKSGKGVEKTKKQQNLDLNLRWDTKNNETELDCKDGKAKCEVKWESKSETKKSTDVLQWQKAFEKPTLKREEPDSYFVPSVPYNLTEFDYYYSYGTYIDNITKQFFENPDVNTLGIGILSVGSGKFGYWEYRINQVWTRMNVFSSNPVLDVSLQKRLSEKQEIYHFPLENFGQQNSELNRAFLLSPTSLLRFKVSTDQFWTKKEACKVALIFVAWNGEKESQGNFITINDFTECQECDKLGLSLTAIKLCPERLGCDNVSSSQATEDQCGVCGGTDECVDCFGVAYGSAKYECGTCVNNPAGEKCGDTTKSESKVDCAGQKDGTAHLNQCQICVGGRTGKGEAEGLDKCGVCNGTNDCIGCDGVANSKKKLDSCKRCLAQDDPDFDMDCTIHLSQVSPKMLDTGTGSQHKLRIEFSGSTRFSNPDEISIECWLESSDAFSQVARGMAEPEFAEKTLLYADYSLLLASAEKATIYHIKCVVDQSHVKDSNIQIIVMDFTRDLQTDGFKIQTNSNDYRTSKVKIKFKQKIDPNIVSKPFCVVNKNLEKQYIASFDFNQNWLECDLESLNQNKFKTDYYINAILREELLQATVRNQNPIKMTTGGDISIESVRFSNDLTAILIVFSENVEGAVNCNLIFAPVTLSKLGNRPECKLRANELYVRIGKGGTIRPTDDIKLDLVQLGLKSMKPSIGGSDIQTMILEKPLKTIVPEITVSNPKKLRSCDMQLSIEVWKTRGSGGREMTYHWTIASENGFILPNVQHIVEQTKSQTLTLERSLLQTGATYIFSVVSCNFLPECCIPIYTTVNVSDTSESFVVEIQGLELPVVAGKMTKLFAVPQFKICSSVTIPIVDVKYKWTINDELIENKKSILRLPEFSFQPYQNMTIFVEGTFVYMNKEYKGVDEISFTTTTEPLELILDSSELKIGSQAPLEIDASRSYDPNIKNSELTHKWTCESAKGAPCLMKDSKSFGEVINTDNSKLIVSAGSLTPGSYIFKDTVSSAVLAETGTVFVTIVEESVPKVQLIPLRGSKANVDSHLKLQAQIESEVDTDMTWSFSEKEGFGYVDLEKSSVDNTEELPSAAIRDNGFIYTITLPPSNSSQWNGKGLEPGVSYSVRLQAKTAQGTAQSEISFKTNSAPKIGKLEVSPLSGLVALTTELKLRVGAGWIDDPEDYPFSYQFGLRTHRQNMPHLDMWFARTTNWELSIYLAAAWPAPHAVCGVRTGYEPLLRVCDRHDACSETVGPMLTVGHPVNAALAYGNIEKMMQADLQAGYSFGAYQKIEALRAEQCWSTVEKGSEKLAEHVAQEILIEMNTDLSTQEMLEGLLETVDLLSNMNSNETLDQLQEMALVLARQLGLLNEKKRRSKRAIETTKKEPITVAEAASLLAAYEILVRSGRQLTNYLTLLEEIMSDFCRQLDSSREPLLVHAPEFKITALSAVQSQVLEMKQSVLENFYHVTKSKSDAKLKVSAELQQKFMYWQCDQGKSTCNSICFGTATLHSAEISPLLPAFFVEDVSKMPVNISRLRSDIYGLYLIDSISGSFVNHNSDIFKMQVPLKNTLPLEYYGCFVFNSVWNSTKCDISILSQGLAECKCRMTGYIAVFTIPPPPPKYFAPHMEVRIMVDTDWENRSLTEAQLSQIVMTWAQAAGVDSARLVKVKSHGEKFEMTLRPSYKPTHLSNSDAVAILNRTTNTAGTRGLSLLKFSDGTEMFVSPFSFSAASVKRDLKRDNNARGIIIKIMGNYEKIVTDQEMLVNRWTSELVQPVGISKYRIWKMKITQGQKAETIAIFFSLLRSAIKSTVKSTLSPAISAEEAALILKERVKYGEVSLTDLNDKSVKIISNSTEIYEIIVRPAHTPTDPLPLIIGGSVAAFFVIVLIMVIVLVVIKQKNRQDKVSPSMTPDRMLISPVARDDSGKQVASAGGRKVSITQKTNKSTKSTRNRRR